MSNQTSGPDGLHERLLADNRSLRREWDAAQAEARRLRVDPRTGFLREHPFMEHLDTLLHARLKMTGAVKLLRGVSPNALSDDEIYRLTEAMVLATPGSMKRSEWRSQLQQRLNQEGTLEVKGWE